MSAQDRIAKAVAAALPYSGGATIRELAAITGLHAYNVSGELSRLVRLGRAVKIAREGGGYMFRAVVDGG